MKVTPRLLLLVGFVMMVICGAVFTFFTKFSLGTEAHTATLLPQPKFTARDDWTLYKEPSLGIQFLYPPGQGELTKRIDGECADGNKQVTASCMHAVYAFGNVVKFLSVTGSNYAPPGRESIVGDESWRIKNSEDVRNICHDGNSSCKTYVTPYGITVSRILSPLPLFGDDLDPEAKVMMWYLYPNVPGLGVVVFTNPDGRHANDQEEIELLERIVASIQPIK